MKLFLFLGEAKTDWTGMFPEHRLGHLLFVMTMSPRIDVLSLSYLCLQDKDWQFLLTGLVSGYLYS